MFHQNPDFVPRIHPNVFFFNSRHFDAPIETNTRAPILCTACSHNCFIWIHVLWRRHGRNMTNYTEKCVGAFVSGARFFFWPNFVPVFIFGSFVWMKNNNLFIFSYFIKKKEIWICVSFWNIPWMILVGLDLNCTPPVPNSHFTSAIQLFDCWLVNKVVVTLTHLRISHSTNNTTVTTPK